MSKTQQLLEHHELKYLTLTSQLYEIGERRTDVKGIIAALRAARQNELDAETARASAVPAQKDGRKPPAPVEAPH